MKTFLISWFHTADLGTFNLDTPWWVQGCRQKDGQFDDIIYAAVVAENPVAASELVLAAFDKRPTSVEWRACEGHDEHWSPFSDRFPRQPWMRWRDTVMN